MITLRTNTRIQSSKREIPDLEVRQGKEGRRSHQYQQL